MSRSSIFIGDFLHALVELGIDSPAVARDVMRMLSIDSWTDIADRRALVSEPSQTAPAAASTVEGSAARSGAGPARLEHPGAGPLLDHTRAVAELKSSSTRPSVPAWVTPERSLAQAGNYARPPPDALFDPRQKRAIIASLAAARVEDEAIDIDALSALLARGEPVTTLPNRRGWGLRHGLQVLIDRGAGMAPFTADIEQLLAELLRLLPRDRVQHAKFTGSPLRGVQLPKKKLTPWRPPLPETSLLLVSDLGLCSGDERVDSAGVAEWLELAGVARRAGVQLRTLVPYPAGRWPGALTTPLRCIHWDCRTTAGITRRVLAGLGT